MYIFQDLDIRKTNNEGRTPLMLGKPINKYSF